MHPSVLLDAAKWIENKRRKRVTQFSYTHVCPQRKLCCQISAKSSVLDFQLQGQSFQNFNFAIAPKLMNTEESIFAYDCKKTKAR